MAAHATGDSIATRKPNIFKRIMNYISESDTSRIDTSRVKWFVLGGPHYETDSKLGLALAGSISYRMNGCDFSLQPSNAMLKTDITTAGFWSVAMVGTTIFPDDSKRLNYELRYDYAPSEFWGMGYDRAVEDKSIQLHGSEAKIQADMMFRIARNVYVGPAIEWNYATSGKVDSDVLFDGQDRTVRNYGAGYAIQYDSRDLITNASRGVYVYLKQVFKPKFLWNKYAFTTTDFRAAYYHTAWRDAVIAAELRGLFNFGNPSWAMMSRLGNNANMRGYYKGRFRDKHSMSAQVEVRQHIWRHSGIVAWVGVGNVFHDTEHFKKLLPNFGIGYRFEVRKKMNIRFDYGFGTHGEHGLVMSMYESF